MFLIKIEKKAIEIQGWFSYGCPTVVRLQYYGNKNIRLRHKVR